MDTLAIPQRTRRSSTGLTLLPGAAPPPRAPAPVGTAEATAGNSNGGGAHLYAAGHWVSSGPFSYGTTGNMARPVDSPGRGGGGGRTPSADVASIPLAAPTFEPSQRYDAAGRPDVHGGASANFKASLARDQTLAPANTALQSQRNTLMADADRAAPPIPLTEPTPTAGTPYANQATLYDRPKMGTAYARLSDGTEVTRQYQQTAESPRVKEARSRALSLSLSPDDVAKGEAAFADSLAGSKATFDATHLPPADPRATVANALAGKYDKEGDAAKTRAENDTTRARSTVTLNDAHSKYWGTLGEAAQTKAKADAQAAIAKGDLDAAIKILTGEKTTTERETRPGKVQGLTVKNQAASDANTRANLRLPYQQYADVTRGLHQSLNPVTGEPIAGTPQPPASFPQAGTAGQPLALAPQPATPPVTNARPTLYDPRPATAQPPQPQQQPPAPQPGTAPAPAAQPVQSAPRLKVPAGGADNGDGTMTLGGGRYAPANVNGQWHWRRVG